MSVENEVQDTYNSILSKWAKAKIEVEITTKEGVVTGVITGVGIDYILVNQIIQGESSTIPSTKDEEKVTSIEIVAMEVLLKLEDVAIASKIKSRKRM